MMIFRFGRFELEEGKRELRLDQRSLELQPRVFDLLVYLVRNRERVVSKDELLDALWSEVTVTDSSIMRAVSVIRTLLREGGQPDAIQTFSRQGYRFVAELGEHDTPASPDRDVARARAAVKSGDWPQALAAFGAVTLTRLLQAGDYEQWAHAALYVGQPNEAIFPLERAVAAHLQNADRLAAARAMITLTNLNLEARALPIAKGWHRRASTFLAAEPEETREHGLHRWLASRIAMFEGDLAQALEHAKHAEALARRVNDPEVEALGLVYRAHVELATGEIRAGLVHMDEAGAAALAGTIGAWATGFVFCAVIWAYLDRGDVTRAGQWSEQFTRWVKRNPAFGAPGLCRLHRGELLCLQGDLTAAESELHRARELLAESARYAEGDACRVLGEVRLLRGDHAGAEAAFRQAHELGWNPLPGWALLLAQKAHFPAAIKALQRGLEAPSWADGQRRGILLAHLARIAALAGQLPLARQSLAELEASSQLRETAGCEAAFHQARAEIARVEQRADEALRALRAALAIWMEAGSRINAAHIRLRLAETLAHFGERDEAELELSGAEKAFAKMEADRMVACCAALRKQLLADDAQGSRSVVAERR